MASTDTTSPGPAGAAIETDALIIGAGPVGLFQVFQLGLQEIRAHVVDSLPRPGGQPVELYPDKPIYDIPGIPVCTGRGLADALLRQIAPFDAAFHLGQTVRLLQRREDGRFDVATSKGTRFVSKTVFIAAGVGAFEPRTLKVQGLAAFEGTQVFHRASDAPDLAGQRVLVVGGDDAALEVALKLAADGPGRAASVTLLHRRETLQASADALAQMRALCDAGRMRFVVGQVTGAQVQGGRLSAAEVTGSDGQVQALPLDALLVCLGLSPKLGPIADWGLDLERKQVPVDTATFSTRVPGLFAVGDINTYPGKKKLILSGFHECTLAAFAAAPIVYPDQGPPLLQYTTTSPRLHRLLGVQPPAND
ncbi:MAG: hypothetical protein RIQ96_287 [Pseudomonadota bacterium]